MARVDVGVLGPLTVARDGERAPVPSGLATKLVVILAAGRAHGATDEQLLERLWADPIPFAALASLRNTVSRLRKLLGDDVLARTATGYALGPDVAVDLDRLEEHHARARAAAATGDRAAARRQLDAALGLVRAMKPSPTSLRSRETVLRSEASAAEGIGSAHRRSTSCSSVAPRDRPAARITTSFVASPLGTAIRSPSRTTVSGPRTPTSTRATPRG